MASKRAETGNSGLIKSMNKRIVLDILLRNEAVSRTMLSELAGLAMPTVMRIVDSFIADGLISEIGKGDSSGGRKPVMLQINPNAYYFLGTDVSRECHSVVANIHGEIIGSAQCVMDYSGGTQAVTEQIRRNMRKAVANSQVAPERIVYSGVGLPGIGFKFLRNSNLSFAFWSDADRGAMEAQLRIGYPTIIENVGRLGAAAELKFGLGRHLRNFLYIYADDGISMGAVIDGRLETGHSGIGGEFGHTSVNFAGELCYCGNRGCVESYCSIYALIRAYETSLINQGLPGGTPPPATFFDFLYAAEKGDQLALDVTARAGTILGIGIGNLINLYNPEAVILSGTLCKTLPLYAAAAEAEARRHIFLREAQAVKFHESTLDRHSEAVGAVALASEYFFAEYCKK